MVTFFFFYHKLFDYLFRNKNVIRFAPIARWNWTNVHVSIYVNHNLRFLKQTKPNIIHYKMICLSRVFFSNTHYRYWLPSIFFFKPFVSSSFFIKFNVIARGLFINYYLFCMRIWQIKGDILRNFGIL